MIETTNSAAMKENTRQWFLGLVTAHANKVADVLESGQETERLWRGLEASELLLRVLLNPELGLPSAG